MTESNAKNSDARELVITRVFDAPRELVWRAWTDPEHLMRWWGPKDFTSPVCKMDFRVGGKYLFCMRSPEGKDFWSTGTYKEIIPLEKIVASDSFADSEGNVIPASQLGMPGEWPLELEITTTFEDLGDGRTRLTVHQVGVPVEMVEMSDMGWNQSLDKLAESLK